MTEPSFGMAEAEKPKPEIRNPKEIRIRKPRVTGVIPLIYPLRRVWAGRGMAFRISDFFRPSDFGFRIWWETFPLKTASNRPENHGRF